MVLQGGAVVIDAVKHYRGDREHHAQRREFSFSEDVMDQAAVLALYPKERLPPILACSVTLSRAFPACRLGGPWGRQLTDWAERSWSGNQD
jgi:hypothetical protein